MLKNKKELAKEDWEKLPDWVQDEYAEKDGKYLLKEQPAPDPADKTRLETIRRTADANARKAQDLQAIVDRLPKKEDGTPYEPDELETILSEYQEAKSTADKVPDKLKGAADKAVEAARLKWDREKKVLEKERDEEREANHQLLVRGTITRWIAENVDPKHQKAVEAMLLQELSPEVRREVVDGKPVRKPVTKIDGFDEDLTAYLDEKWKGTETAKNYLRAADNSGGDLGDGTKPKSEAAPTTITNKSQFKSNKEKSDFIDKFGGDVYNALPPA